MSVSPRWLRDWLRPAYLAVLELATLGRGLPVRVGGLCLRLAPSWHRAFAGFEPEGLRVVKEVLRPGDLAVDVGAHVGVYSLAMAAAVGRGGRVLAFEPNPSALVDLRRHLDLNDAANIVEVQVCGLGEVGGIGHLHTRAGPAGPGSSLYPQPDLPQVLQVQVRHLDGILPQDDLPRLIKLDVEGYERRVLLGCRRLLTRATSLVILCEVHVDNMHFLDETPEMLYDLLDSLGYAAFTLNGERVTAFAASAQYLFRRAD